MNRDERPCEIEHQPITNKPAVQRLLIVEDNTRRIECFRAWLPVTVHPVWAASAGRALGILHRCGRDNRDWGRRSLDYAGILLDHDLVEQCVVAGEDRFSGIQVADAIIQHISRDVPILLHSMNLSRARAMEAKLIGEDFDIWRTPMTALTREIFKVWLDYVQRNWLLSQTRLKSGNRSRSSRLSGIFGIGNTRPCRSPEDSHRGP